MGRGRVMLVGMRLGGEGIGVRSVEVVDKENGGGMRCMI